MEHNLHSTTREKSIIAIPTLLVAMNLYIPPSSPLGFVKMTMLPVADVVMLLGTGAVDPTLSTLFSVAGLASTAKVMEETASEATTTSSLESRVIDGASGKAK